MTMTTGQLIDLLIEDAELYIKESKASVTRNRHMNDLKPEDNVDQKVIDAAVVDFINFVGGRRGVDVGMYTKDLRKEE